MLLCWLPSWQPSATISQSAQRWGVARGVPASTICTMSSCWSVATRNLDRPRTRSSLWTRTSGWGTQTHKCNRLHLVHAPCTVLSIQHSVFLAPCENPDMVRHRMTRYIQQKLCSLCTRSVYNVELAVHLWLSYNRSWCCVQGSV